MSLSHISTEDRPQGRRGYRRFLSHPHADGRNHRYAAKGRRTCPGVTDFLVHSVATTPHQVKSVNEFVAKEVSLFPDKLIGFGTLHPESQDIKGDIEHLIALGLKGVKLHPDFLGIPIDDERYFDIYERAEGRLPICFHTGDDRYDYSNPNRVAPLLKRFPNLTVIAAHFGGYTVWEEASYALGGRA